MAMGYWLDGRGSTLHRAHPMSAGISEIVKLPEVEAIAEVKYLWSYASTSHGT
jgi:hypothetical protein